MSFDEPTQRLRRPSPPHQPGPEALDLTRPDATEPLEDSDPTGVLPLDELLGPAEPDEPTKPQPLTPQNRPAPAPTPAPAKQTPTAEPARSEIGPGPDGEPARPPASRLRADGAAAVYAGAEQLKGWLRHDDNALTLVTALVAILLLSVVAAFGA